ncbi:MAG TPA: ABC transporter transmembrane domain-containing protein [Thermoanaerobaculia bacterium]|jgi:subfamily B ATP-binding cassette protein MsbA|nr:ABC transporter transmembrane domain-containing protein [Thermoanaerobaculia bacterium]
MNVLGRLYRYLRRYKTWALIAFGSMIIFAATQTMLMALIQPLFDEVLTPPRSVAPASAGGAPAKAGATPLKQRVIDSVLRRDQPEGQRGWFINSVDRAAKNFDHWWNAKPADKWKRVLTALLLVFVIRAFTSFFSEYAFQKVGLSTVRDLRNELYESIIRQSHRFFSERSTGEMVSRVVSDADAIQAAVSTRMGDLFQESITLIGLTLYVFISNTELALISLIVAPVIVMPVIHFGRRLRGTTHRSQERMADIATLLEETIRGVRIVKAFTMEPFEIGRFREATLRHLKSNLKAQRIQALTSPVMELLAGSMMLLLFLYAHRRIAAGTLTVGQFVSFLAALAAMYAPIKKLNKVNLSVNTALSAAERVFRMLDVDNEVKEKPNAIELTGVGRGVRYENVTFAYGAEPVLRNVDLAVAPGELVALVGSSGAGKSTLVNLLPRFYDVSDGRITVDGKDVRDVTLKSLRGLMGFVTQEVILFNDTVRNNIAYGRGDADERRVVEAAKAANAHDFISNLPNGYDALIGEAGVLLSGGQRQRLAIARALFKDPPILILDEATSALDTESERLVQQALVNLMRGRTTLVIAHRLSTIRSAHKIVVLEKGEIAEVGRHDELLGFRGIYRKLYDMQFATEEQVLA